MLFAYHIRSDEGQIYMLTTEYKQQNDILDKATTHAAKKWSVTDQFHL